MGVSSHELFHAWNIKSIRPIEMFPYDYSKENYSNLGYVAEGVTSYYGDLVLYRAGVFADFDYFKTLFDRVQKHFDNFGRFQMSVAESSFDTWLDGYSGKSIPDRSVSIYTEGCLIALMCDLIIRKNSQDKNSLDNVMYDLYHNFAEKNKGYSELDYKNLLEKYAETSFDDFFKKYIWGKEDFEPELKSTLSHIGCELISVKSRKYYEANFGFKVHDSNCRVTHIYPNSEAERSGLWHGDTIISVNGYELGNSNNTLNEWCRYFTGEPLNFTVKRENELFDATMLPSKNIYYKIHYISKIKDATEQQMDSFEKWSKRKFKVERKTLTTTES